ncbi:hypothetical protein ACXZ65_30780 [Streptomyces aculeolatus]
MTAGLLTGGLLLIVLGFETVVQPVVGLVMLALAGSLRPRFARLDPDLPALYLRAEFRADALAARTASTEAAVGALRAQGLADSVTLEVHRLAVAAYTFGRAGGTREGEQDLWEKLAAHAAGLSERVRDTSAEAGTPGPDGAAAAADGTVLPAARARVDRLLQAPYLPAVITPDATATEAIGNELRGPMRLLARKVVQDRVFA